MTSEVICGCTDTPLEELCGAPGWFGFRACSCSGLLKFVGCSILQAAAEWFYAHMQGFVWFVNGFSLSLCRNAAYLVQILVVFGGPWLAC